MKNLLFTRLLLVLLLAGCGSPPAPEISAVTAQKMSLTSPAFQPSAAIPALYTCSGEDISPALQWDAPPEGTRSLALIMDDPDAPLGTWVHWVVYNLPAEATGLAEGASRANGASFDLPAGAQQGKTSFGRADYGGPCPPSGQHRYYFKLYALDITLEGDQLSKDDLLKAMEGHVLATGELVGVFQK